MVLLSVGMALGAAWELAGIYDATSLVATTPAPAEAGWVWRASPGMEASCGAPKSPDGLGVIEAQAVANGLTPVLAVVLRRTEADAPALDTGNVFLAVSRGGSTLRLAPMVEPSSLVIDVGGEGLETHKQLLRTQLAMEMCLQNDTGRRWAGGDWVGLRQAFLLDEPTDGERTDQMFFRGQRKPVAALLGPADACFESPTGPARTGVAAGAAPALESPSLALVPSDIWGASLRTCAVDEVPAALVRDRGAMMPLRLGGVDEEVHALPPQWIPVEIQVHGTSDADASIEVTLAGEVLDSGPLFRRVDDGTSNGAKVGIDDVLASVPARYPAMGDAADPGRYTVLLVPNWQIVRAVSTLYAQTPELDVVADGVGWVLAHPEQLVLQVGTPTNGTLPQLMSKYRTVQGRFLRWGYMVGIYAGRSEIVLPSPIRPTWAQTEAAQRAREHAIFLASAAIATVLFLLGLRRLRDLWVRVPEERVNYWPGTAAPTTGGGPAPATPLGDMGTGE